MTGNLTNQEQVLVENFLKQFKSSKNEFSKYFLSFVVFSLAGLFMIVYTSILTLNNMIDRVVHWVFLPGIISGIFLILTGFFIWQFYKKNLERQKLAKIIEKLIQV